MLNTLRSYSRIALKLSASKGLGVKFFEGLHKSIFIIVRDVSVLSLQIKHGKRGFVQLQRYTRESERL
jgi:hypothetical protein